VESIDWFKLSHHRIMKRGLRSGKNFILSSCSAMSNPNGLLSQKLCHCLNQGRTLNNILMRAAHWMAYFDFNKLNLAYTTLKSTGVSVCFRGISRLPSALVFLRWFKLAHISIKVCTFHDGCKQGSDQQISILLKICWSIPCLAYTNVMKAFES